ncbi:hypothetical protein A3J41_02635 [candidate division TM6 bacterium RIFCSPHIGHO2_12_FULL_38_8]|nr:MAG: hypothetical protein A3J41_02635 [candidate division TM6 bacterium RIFCSPHIGHO2_12_FULL_38_8]
MNKIFAISLLFFQSIVATNYEIKLLDRSNTKQVEQVRQLFLTSPVQSNSDINSADLEKWIAKDSRHFLLAINNQGIVCGAAIYYVSIHHHLWINAIAVASKFEHHDIVTKLLAHLESVPDKTNIGTTVTKKIIAFYKLFKKLGYIQTDQFLTMSKSIDQTCIATSPTSDLIIRFLDNNNPKEVEQFAQLFDASEVGGEWTPEQMQKFITYQNYRFLAAFDSSNQLCAGLIYHLLAKQWEIYILSVRKNCRRCGIATTLIKAIEEQARQVGITQLTLSVLPTNHAAISCYQKAGFIKEEVIYKFVKEMN